MTGFVATAPGKLVLTGEYAVLSGAPALVMAVDRYASATIKPAPDGRNHFANEDLIKTTLAAFPFGALLPFDLTCNTDAFSAGDQKLGIGSSAALVTALSGALAAWGDQPLPDLRHLIRVHREFQNGRGSGLDIAAAYYGGMISYALKDDIPAVKTHLLPHGLHMLCIWTGTSAATSDFLAQLADFENQDPKTHTLAMKSLSAAAQAAAVSIGRAETFLEAYENYAQALKSFGNTVKLEIFSSDHLTIGKLAADTNVAYKPSGAGGGDMGIALSDDPERLQVLAQKLQDTRYHIVNLKPAATGLLIKDQQEEQKHVS